MAGRLAELIWCFILFAIILTTLLIYLWFWAALYFGWIAFTLLMALF